MWRFFLCLLIILASLFFCSATREDLGYEVLITGVEQATLKKAFASSSACFQEKEKPIPTIALLKRRAQSDLEKMTELAHYYGYYSAKVSFVLQMAPQIGVHFTVHLGPQYTLKNLELVSTDTEAIPKPKATIGKAITTKDILTYEKELVWELKKKGYATAKVAKKDIFVDAADHTVTVRFHVDNGPLVHFGPTKIIGNKTVLAKTIEKNILYKEGDRYDPLKIEQTESALEDTSLFSSVTISQDELLNGTLPLDIHVHESKHKSVGAGVSYTTSWGPGIIAEWENKNLGGKGEKLTFKTEVWERYQTALLSLAKPKFHGTNQDMIWLAEYDKIQTLAFDSRSYNISPLIQWRIHPRTEISYGGRFEWLNAKNFEGNHDYYLIKAPLQLKWSNANNLLDPTKGQTLNVKFTPTSQLKAPHFIYGIQNTTLTTYYTIPSNVLTIALKATFGNIIGAARHTIPAPDRLYGGTENGLRGYRAYTVSPLHDHKIPIGGRSLLMGSVEARFRTQGAFGWALFYDVGNVYSTNIPKITIHQLQSVGGGIRYNTPLGPLRFDVAVPLNPRANIDSHFQIYFSIGQAF
jgi:translocation and assembly module TamA